MLKVCKFGGSSVAGAEQFRKVRDIVLSDESRRVVVISAAGKRFGDDHKLTDLLYLIHAHLTYGVSCDEILKTVEDRLTAIRDELDIPVDIAAELAAFHRRLSKDTSADEIVSRGEYFTARLMAAFLGYAFVDAADCVFFGLDGSLDRETTDAAIAEALERHGRIVIPGFYGQLPTGRLRVMSRGGSDITGAIAAAAVNADIYENWTDVSGILMADPRIVDNPAPIEKITFAELRELAYMGASVLHEESVQPVKERGIPLNIRNTNRPEDPGTMIVESVSEDEQTERFITGIAGRKKLHHRHGLQARHEAQPQPPPGPRDLRPFRCPGRAYHPRPRFLRLGFAHRRARRRGLRHHRRDQKELPPRRGRHPREHRHGLGRRPQDELSARCFRASLPGTG